MKKYVAISLVLALGLTLFSGCKSKNTAEPLPTEKQNAVGSFSSSSIVGGKLPDAAKAAFDEANAASTGLNKKALACLGTQVVAGTNYAILETQESDLPDSNETLNVSIYYKAPGKPAVMTKTVAFSLNSYVGNDNPEIAQKDLQGSWRIPEGGSLTSMPQDMATFTSQALLSYDKLTLNLLACVGKQIVSGTNYAFIATGTDNNSNTGLFIAIIYVDLQANAKVLKVCPLSVSEIIK